MTINVADKKRFLNWFVSHVSFSRREVSWILNYLATHETILKNVCFVEHAEKTPRGIRVQGIQAEGEPISLFLKGKIFVDSDQIFHEIRLNWKEPLYLECLFPNCWSNEFFLAVLEDNPHYRWNETLDAEMATKVDAYFSQADIDGQISVLYKQIDEALGKGEQERFLNLSAEVNQLLAKKSMVTK
ncbi:YpiB family protein [Enterococcus olivae]